jgi:uncharacterized membrane protein
MPDALLAGLACSMRSFSGPAVLAARGRLSGRARTALLVLGAGELVFDKLSFATPRTDPPALGGRVVTGALTGRAVGGWPGLALGAAAAAAGTFATVRARSAVVERTGLPDPAVAAGEDALAYGLAAFVTR